LPLPRKACRSGPSAAGRRSRRPWSTSDLFKPCTCRRPTASAGPRSMPAAGSSRHPVSQQCRLHQLCRRAQHRPGSRRLVDEARVRAAPGPGMCRFPSWPGAFCRDMGWIPYLP
jgi:hypothetical protein